MKFVFIINPVAGTGDKQKLLKNALEKLDGIYDFDVLFTKAKDDATKLVLDYKNNEPVCFVACGGDGTLNEVARGVFSTKHKMACIPCGSGNDFIKNFTTYDYFDLDALFSGKEEQIDVLLCNERVCMNTCCLGFDAVVASKKDKFKLFGWVSGKTRYILSLIVCFAKAVTQNVKIIDDNGNYIFNGNVLLCLLANGQVYGGGFRGAPLARMDDGLIDLCLCRAISRRKMMALIPKYKSGKHLGNPDNMRYITYVKSKSFTVSAEQNFVYCIDGECFEGKELTVSVIPKSLGFWAPTYATQKIEEIEKETAFV